MWRQVQNNYFSAASKPQHPPNCCNSHRMAPAIFFGPSSAAVGRGRRRGARMQGMMPNFQGINPALAINGSAGSKCHVARHVTPPTPLLSAARLINIQEHASRVFFCPADHCTLHSHKAQTGRSRRHIWWSKFGWMHTSQPISPPPTPGLPNPIVRLLAQP